LEPDVQEEVAWAIGVLASDPESETLLAELGAVRSLLQYLRSGTEAVKKRAQWSLGMLTTECLKYNELLAERESGAKDAEPHASDGAGSDVDGVTVRDKKNFKKKVRAVVLTRSLTAKQKGNASAVLTRSAVQGDDVASEAAVVDSPDEDAVIDAGVVEADVVSPTDPAKLGMIAKMMEKKGGDAGLASAMKIVKQRPTVVKKRVARSDGKRPSAGNTSKDVRDLISKMRDNSLQRRDEDDDPDTPPKLFEAVKDAIPTAKPVGRVARVFARKTEAND
jgi:hypothetical protein